MFGLVSLLIQLFVCVIVTAVGIWAVVRPKHLQHFVSSNFALLPDVKDGLRLTPILIRLAGIYLIWFGYTFALSFRQELSWIGHRF